MNIQETEGPSIILDLRKENTYRRRQMHQRMVAGEVLKPE